MKLTKVSQVCQNSEMMAIVVHQDTPLENVVQHFAENPMVRGIFVVDDTNKLIGVVNNHELLPWARMNLDMSPFGSKMPVGKMRRLLLAERIMDLAQAGSHLAAVQIDASLADALDAMFRHNLVDIPVVDENGRIINDLRLSEILAFTLKQSNKE